MMHFMYNIFMIDLLPIIVIMVIGYLSAKKNIFTQDQGSAFNKLVLDYALPAALFVSISKADRATIFADTTLTVVSTVVLVIIFFVSFFCCKYFFKRTQQEAAVCALIAGSPTIGFLGFAIFDPIYGDTVSTGLVVAIISIIVNAICIPIGLLLFNLQDKRSAKKVSINGQTPISTTSTSSGFDALLSAIKQPVVWAPVLATILVLLDIKFPPILDPTFELIAKANSGMAVFAAGLMIAANKLEFNFEIAFNTFLKLILMPAALLAVGLLCKMEPIHIQMIVLAGALPPAFSGVIIAGRYNTYTRIGTASLAVSIVGFIFTAPLWIYITKIVTS